MKLKSNLPAWLKYMRIDTLKAIEELRRDIILAGRQETLSAVVGEGMRHQCSRAPGLTGRQCTPPGNGELRRLSGTSMPGQENSAVVWVKPAWPWKAGTTGRACRADGGRNRFDMSPDDMAEVLNIDRAIFTGIAGFVYGVAERLGWY